MSSSQPAQRGVLQQVMCLLLCLAAWRGPMPVLHDHATSSNGGQLQEHCLNFHGECDADCHGLHFHFAMPRDVYGDSCPDSDETIPEITTFACATGTSTAPMSLFEDVQSLDAVDASMSVTPQVTAVCRLDSPRHQSGSFLSTLCDSRSLSSVIGSWRL